MMEILDFYIQKWGLIIDGTCAKTNTSIILPCIYKKLKAMLKIPLTEEEQNGIKLIQWWKGIGAVKILEIDDNALLMERIENINGITLKKLVDQGNDTESTRIICQTAKLLHTAQTTKQPPLTPLRDWFNSLVSTKYFSNEIFKESASLANSLLNNQIEPCVLHGDLHHENILYSDIHGWVAIDPKGLYGDRAFDFVNLLCNPNKAKALEDGRLVRQLTIIHQETNIEFARILDWLIAWVGLSAIWMEEDHLDASLPLNVGKLALELKMKLYKNLFKFNN